MTRFKSASSCGRQRQFDPGPRRPESFRPFLRELSNPVPFDHLCGSSDILIGVDVAGSPGGNDQKFPSSLDALYGVGQLMQQSIIALKLRAFPPDVLLKPEVSKVRTLDFMKARDILAQSAGIKDETKLAVDREFLKHRVKLAG